MTKPCEVGSAWPGPPPVCNKIRLGSLEDQCVATNLMLRSNGTIVLDSHEHLFASGSIVVGRNDSGQTYATRAGGIICGPDKCLLGTRFTSSWSWSKDDRWRRLGPYSKECAIAQDSGPTLIHFNGVSKRFVSDPKSPLQYHHPLELAVVRELYNLEYVFQPMKGLCSRSVVVVD